MINLFCIASGWMTLFLGLWNFNGSAIDAALIANGVLNFTLAAMIDR